MPTAVIQYLAIALLLAVPMHTIAQEERSDADQEQGESEVVNEQETEGEEVGESEANQTSDDASDATSEDTSDVPGTFDPLMDEVRAIADRVKTVVNSPFSQPVGDPVAEAMRRESQRIRDLRQRVTRFNEVREPTERTIAVEAQLAMWLNESEHLKSMLDRVEAVAPESTGLRILRADLLKQNARYEDALQVLNDTGYDAARLPVANMIRAETLIAEHRFDEAAAALEAIAQDASMEGRVLNRYWQDRNQLRQLIEDWAVEQEIRSSEAAADDLPRVELITVKGRIVLELFENQAPNTVANFISLVEKDFYDGTTFHRVISDFMTQGGDPNSKPDVEGVPGTGGPGYTIPDELPESEYRKHFAGSLSMANSGPDTGASQFFITHRPTPHLDGRHTVFGRTLEGLDVARAIERDDVLQEVNILRTRDHEYTPETQSGEEEEAEDVPEGPMDTNIPDDATDEIGKESDDSEEADDAAESDDDTTA